jgi:hypothetical protein
MKKCPYNRSGLPWRGKYSTNLVFYYLSASEMWIDRRNGLVGGVIVMVFNATFNNISVNILWRSVLLVEETGVPEENHRPAASHWQTLSHNRKWTILSWYKCSVKIDNFQNTEFKLNETFNSIISVHLFNTHSPSV